jgi:hypothetical protein
LSTLTTESIEHRKEAKPETCTSGAVSMIRILCCDIPQPHKMRTLLEACPHCGAFVLFVKDDCPRCSQSRQDKSTTLGPTEHGHSNAVAVNATERQNPSDLSPYERSVIGGVIGLVAGFAIGVVGWLVFFYVVFMLPNGTPWRLMDQGAIPTVFTGPCGAVIGAILAGFVFRRRLKPVVLKQATAEPTAPPNGGPATPSAIGEPQRGRPR